MNAIATPSQPSPTHASTGLPRWQLWTGRVLSLLPIGMLLMSAAMKFAQPPEVAKMFVDKFGYPLSSLTPIGVVEVLCVALYAIPRTSVLGAILLTGYLGGATATHVRVSDAFIAPVALGVAAWLGLYLRDVRLRSLVPLRSPSTR